MAEGECKALSLIFRIAALGLAVAAAIVMATASQLVIVAGEPQSSSYSSTSVSYSQYNALRYFVAASAISAVCSAVALYLFAVRAAAAVVGSMPLVRFLDAAAQGFLFSAAGAAFATRDVVGGGTVTGAAGPWGSGGAGGGGGGSVCDAAGAFCGRVTVAAAVCAFAAVSVAVAALASRDAGHGSSGRRRCDW